MYYRVSQLLLLIFLAIVCGCQKSKHQSQFETAASELGSKPAAVAAMTNQLAKPAVLYRSIDGGASWSAFATGIPADATASGIKQEGRKLYVSTDDDGVFVRANGQNSWRRLNPEGLRGLDINCIEVEGDQLVIGTLRHGVLVSADAGLTWTPSKTTMDQSPVRAFIKVQEKLYAGTDAGIFESADMGITWSHAFGTMQVLGFTFLDHKLYAATQYGALVCKGDASRWESIYEGDALHDIGNDGKYVYAMTIGQQLLKTQNDGALWENAQRGITQPANFYTNELKHTGSTVFSAQWIGIYRSVNHGMSWEKLSGLPDSTAFSTLEITDYGIIAGISIR